MKPTGCRLSYGEQRDAELYDTYKRMLALQHKENRTIDNMAAIEAAVLQPCSRFWISEGVAAYQIRTLTANPGKLNGMIGTKRAMYENLLEVYAKLRNDPDNDGLDNNQVAYMASDSEARQFYMTPGSALIRICAERRRRMAMKKDASQRLLEKTRKSATVEKTLNEVRSEEKRAKREESSQMNKRIALPHFTEFRPRPLNWHIRKKARTALQYVIKWVNE